IVPGTSDTRSSPGAAEADADDAAEADGVAAADALAAGEPATGEAAGATELAADDAGLATPAAWHPIRAVERTRPTAVRVCRRLSMARPPVDFDSAVDPLLGPTTQPQRRWCLPGDVAAT